jgi:hypothetical protein
VRREYFASKPHPTLPRDVRTEAGITADEALKVLQTITEGLYFINFLRRFSNQINDKLN